MNPITKLQQKLVKNRRDKKIGLAMISPTVRPHLKEIRKKEGAQLAATTGKK